VCFRVGFMYIPLSISQYEGYNVNRFREMFVFHSVIWRRWMSSGMVRHVGWSIGTGMSKYHNAFIFKEFLLLKMNVVTLQNNSTFTGWC
jgi:hypothetical protein